MYPRPFRPTLRWILSTAALFAGFAVHLRAQVTQPLPVDILQTSHQVAGGYVFIAPIGPGGLTPLPNAVQGPEILDNQGRPVWFLPTPDNQLAADFRIQTYQGQPVLTWAQGPGFEYVQPGQTTDYICDSTYTIIATVQAGNGLNADEHEFQLTPQNTALITIYNEAPADLSSVGGPANGVVLEGVAQEIDVATGNVLFEWHSLGHVALTESYMPAPGSADVAYDYFHINSVKLDTDGNLLISARNVSAVYKVNRTSGAIIWRLGGKLSDFTLGPGLPFAFQHDVEAVDSTTLRIFDNESDGTAVLPASRVIWVSHNDTTMTATLVSSIQHPDGLSVLAEGSGQSLANGDTFVDWGILGRYSEFDPNGVLLYDVTLPSGYNSYRGFRFPWVGSPATPPTASAQYNGDGTLTVQAIWNGATQVANWQVMGGDSAGALNLLGTAPWNGLDTPLTVPAQVPYVTVVALDSTGATIGSSSPFDTRPEFITQPSSQTMASGSTVVFRIATGTPQTTYQWTFNGSPIVDGPSGSALLSGTAGPTLVVQGATAADAGAYACTATDPGGSTTSQAATLMVISTQDVGRLINVSARASVGTGNNVLIAGFAVGGQGASGQENVLIRASGPALTALGVSGALPDPELLLFGTPPAAPIAALTAGWGGNSLIAGTAMAVGAFVWGNPSSLDQAAVQTLPIAPYSAEVAGQSGDTGIALAEIYDATPEGAFRLSMPHLTNVSARANVGSGGNILFGGFVIGGATSKTVLIRASGPALAAFGLSGVLSDPQLQLYATSSGNLLASNTGWNGDPEIAAAAASSGAFPWGDGSSQDSAILITLAPGAYAAQVMGQSGDSGLALIEVYEIP